MDFKLNPGDSFAATANFTDSKGIVRPLPAGVIPAWATVPDGACALTPAADGMTCAGVAGDGLQDFKLTATAECDPTPGVNTVVASIDGHIVAPEDTVGTISVVVNPPAA